MRPRPAALTRLTGLIGLVALALVAAGCAVAGPSHAPVVSSAVPVGPSMTPTLATASATVTPTGRATVTASSLPSAADVAWHLVTLPDAADAGTIADVATLPGLVIAAAAAGPAAERGVAWASLDRGQTWMSEALPGTGAAVGRLVPWGGRVLAFGVGGGDAQCAHPAVVEAWVRDPAGTWTAAPFDPIFCAGGIAQAATAGAHAVIVGSGTGDVAYAWSSSDGLHWTDRSRTFADRFPQGVAADGSGFLAVGTASSPATAWTARSTDGATWQAPQPLPGLADSSIFGNPVALHGVLTIFAADRAGAVGMLQPDGNGGWRSRPVDGLTRATLVRILAVGDGLLAIGGDEAGPKGWVSSDGLSWSALALPAEALASGPDATLTGAAVADGRAYLTGQILAPAGDRTVGALWTGPASLLAH
jgi:hypothetical protein